MLIRPWGCAEGHSHFFNVIKLENDQLWRFINEERCPTGHPKTSAKAINNNVISENTTKRSDNNFIDLLFFFYYSSDGQCDYSGYEKR